MTGFNRVARASAYRLARSAGSLIGLALLPALVMAQAPLENDPPLNDPQDISATPPATHATQQASDALLITANYRPENFIGKTLILFDGADSVTVGPVLNLRRRIQDQEVYLIVDATPYFKSAGEYAVAVKDVDRSEADKLIIPEAPGMHLRGLDYYPDDYTDIENTVSAETPGEE